MYAKAIAALIGAAVGGIVGGVQAKLSTDRKIKTAQNYADAIKKAAEQYSGNAAYNDISQKGSAEARTQANNFGLMNNPISGIAMNNVNAGSNAQNAYQTGQNIGRSMETDNLNTKYNTATEAARQAYEAENKENKAKDQMFQTAMNTVAGMAGVANQFKGSGGNTGSNIASMASMASKFKGA